MLCSQLTFNLNTKLSLDFMFYSHDGHSGRRQTMMGNVNHEKMKRSHFETV